MLGLQPGDLSGGHHCGDRLQSQLVVVDLQTNTKSTSVYNLALTINMGTSIGCTVSVIFYKIMKQISCFICQSCNMIKKFQRETKTFSSLQLQQWPPMSS